MESDSVNDRYISNGADVCYLSNLRATDNFPKICLVLNFLTCVIHKGRWVRMGQIIFRAVSERLNGCQAPVLLASGA